MSGAVAAYQPAEQDVEEIDGSVVYENEELKVNFADSNLNASAGDTIYLVRYTDQPEYTTEETYKLNEDEVVSEISTGELATGERYAFADKTQDGNTDGNFSLLQSGFTAEWERSTAHTDDVIDVDVSSSRTDDYSVTISADGISYDELAALFGDEASIEENREAIPFEELGYEPDDTSVQDVLDDGYLTVSNWQTENGDLRADFSSLSEEEGFPDKGEYEFEFLVSGTGIADSSTIDIREGSESADFTKTVYGEPAGDLAQFEFNLAGTDETFIQIKSEGAFADIIYVKLKDVESTASVQVNTRLLGTDHRSIDGAGEVYQTENIETLVSAYHDGPSERFDSAGAQPFNDGSLDGSASPTFGGVPIFGTGDGTALSYEDYIRAGGYIESGETMGDQLNKPLQPYEYEISIAGYKNVNSDQGVFNAQTGQPFDPLAESSLVLQEPGIADVAVYKLPAGTADSVEDVPTAVEGKPEAENISWGDRVVIKYDMNSIYGTIAAGGQQRDIDNTRLEGYFDTELLRELSKSDNQIKLKIGEKPVVGNQNPARVNFQSDGGATSATVDYKNNDLYVVLNTRAKEAFTKNLPDRRAPFIARAKYGDSDTTKEYRFKGGDPMNGPFSIQSQKNNHPYLSAGVEKKHSARFSIEPPQLSIADKAFGIVPLQRGERVEISAETNLASEYKGTVEIRSNNRTVVGADEISINEGTLTAGPLDLTKFNHGEPVTIVVDVKNSGTWRYSGVIVGRTNDIVLASEGFRVGIDDPEDVENGKLVSQVVSWGSPPPTSFGEEADSNSTEQTNSTEQATNEENATIENSDQGQNGQSESVTGGNQPSGSDGGNSQAQNQVPEQPSEGGGGFGFIPVIGTILLSIIVGAAAAVII
jgi:hypothetical protein